MSDAAIKLLVISAVVVVCLLGYKSWEFRIRLDERAKVEEAMHREFQKKLDRANDKAQQELIAYRNQHAKDYALLRTRANALALELRKRPTRAELEEAARARPTAEPCPVCTGARLAREDGEFLAGEAAGAGQLQLDLRVAVGGYETCRKALEEVTGGKK